LWAGGRFANTAGYILVHRPSHPNAQAGGYIFEHVLVMSEFLGRPLREEENVHHRNGRKADNALNNLELWSKHQPYGQRVEEVYEWAKAYVKQYDADVKKLAARYTPESVLQMTLLDPEE